MDIDSVLKDYVVSLQKGSFLSVDMIIETALLLTNRNPLLQGSKSSC